LDREVRQALTDATADDATRVIILTGAGRGFCAGADIAALSAATDRSEATPTAESQSDFAAGPIPGGLDLPHAFSYQYAYFPTVPKPIIAAINGPVAGLGLVLSLYTDLRFASDTAVFTTAFSRRGLIAEHGIDWILPRVVGLPNALDLLLSGRKVTAQEALQMGLVNRVYPADVLMSEVRTYALELATMVSPRSMRVMKSQLFRAQDVDFEVSLQAGITEMVASLGSEDFKEGVAHFVEKRAPHFSGK
jgi:enoyl-CoA hydratase/carnithine racemase